MLIQIILVWLFAIFTPSVNADLRRQEITNPPLRIGLVRAFSRATIISISAPVGTRVTDPLDSSLLEGPAEWVVTASENQVVISNKDGKKLITGAILRMVPRAEGQGGFPAIMCGKTKRHYRGVIEFQPGPAAGNSSVGAGALATAMVINELPLEDYLRGVVAAEMSDSAPIEALKAQTVAARTYALINRGRYRSRGYDLSDSTDCQVYNGADAEKRISDAAIRDTEGQVLIRNGALVLTDYYDDCGGMTSPGDGPGDYPPSVRDSEDGGPDFCARGTYHDWKLTLTPAQFSAHLGLKERERIGDMHDLRIAKTDPSGRAAAFEISGDKGSIILSGSGLRSRLGYSRMKSTLVNVSRNEKDEFVLDGRGYGHGHGLCQAGAMGMATAPYSRSCGEILEHYFPGSEVALFDGQGPRPQVNADEIRGKLASRHGKRNARVKRD